MSIQHIIDELEILAPVSYQESYDNCGLLVGNRQKIIEKALITLDCTEAVLDEAIQLGCSLVICHHPILFSGIKSITGKNYIERVILKAIQQDIAIYAAHTNLDNMPVGVNAKIAEKLGLKNCQILAPLRDALRHLYVYIPIAHADRVRKALHDAGAGQIGNYESCSFNIEGTGKFKPKSGANPFIGEIDELQSEPETKVEVVFSVDKERAILKALFDHHPYEEVAYGIIPISNANKHLGAGMIGELPEPMEETAFLKFLKIRMSTDCIRHTALSERKISKVALCGGSGSFLLQKAKQSGADVLVTADFKYHQFFDAENHILIADIGHYESEQFTGEIFYEVLSKKFPNFAFHLTSVNTNPVHYY
ncbi:MAG: Nif3-like dinuclear metal center hexameric protein [Chitinophagaceae bacterium]|nr:Nif3-like dinuclear metal center hexameric protein [Chitinophagaceae bacterium]